MPLLQVSHPWRAAVLQPKCWRTLTGYHKCGFWSNDGGRGMAKLFYSKPFLQTMAKVFQYVSIETLKYRITVKDVGASVLKPYECDWWFALIDAYPVANYPLFKVINMRVDCWFYQNNPNERAVRDCLKHFDLLTRVASELQCYETLPTRGWISSLSEQLSNVHRQIEFRQLQTFIDRREDPRVVHSVRAPGLKCLVAVRGIYDEAVDGLLGTRYPELEILELVGPVLADPFDCHLPEHVHTLRCYILESIFPFAILEIMLH